MSEGSYINNDAIQNHKHVGYFDTRRSNFVQLTFRNDTALEESPISVHKFIPDIIDLKPGQEAMLTLVVLPRRTGNHRMKNFTPELILSKTKTATPDNKVQWYTFPKHTITG
jgi:hypothetical protein